MAEQTKQPGQIYLNHFKGQYTPESICKVIDEVMELQNGILDMITVFYYLRPAKYGGLGHGVAVYEGFEEYGLPWDDGCSNSTNAIMAPHLEEVEALLTAHAEFSQLKEIVARHIKRVYGVHHSEIDAKLAEGAKPVACIEEVQYNAKSPSSVKMTNLQVKILNDCEIPILKPGRYSWRGTRIDWRKWAVMQAHKNGIDIAADVLKHFNLA